MRLFVGVELSPEVAAAAADFIEALRERAVQLAPRSRITWITPARLHVTVRFIGHVDEAAEARLIDALRPSLDIDRFDLTVAGAGVFPRKGPPRVVWAGVSSGCDELKAVEQVVSDRLAAAGVDREARSFNPHLTLARVRDAGGLRAPVLLDDLAGTVLGTTPVDAITLFESRLSPKGSRYLAIHRTLLA